MIMLSDNNALNDFKQQLASSKKIERKTGVLKTTFQGFGFLYTDSDEEFFVSKTLMQGLLPKATLTVEIVDNKVVRIVDVHDVGEQEFYCKVDAITVHDREYLNAIPLRKDVLFRVELGVTKKVNAQKGDIVRVTVDQVVAGKKTKFKGHILENMGHVTDPAVMWKLVKSEFALNTPLENLSGTALPPAELKGMLLQKGYVDWTDFPLVTIDSFSARDLDDALYVEDADEVWKLHIAIADPTLLVEQDGSFRELFLSRGVTHYLANDIVHMMSPTDIEQHFSLLEEQIRPAIAAVIEVSKKNGEINNAQFMRVVMQSKAKLTYDQVSEHIKHRAVYAIDSLPQVATSLNRLYEMSQARLAYRKQHNLVSVDSNEHFFIVENYEPVEVITISKKLAHSMVEEAAITANLAFTMWAQERDLSLIYVTHEGFKGSARGNIESYLKSRGFDIKADETLDALFDRAHRFFADKLECAIANHDDQGAASASRSIKGLRSFYKKGELSLVPQPHMPMGHAAYATWTSPIRKAVDMENHLAIKSYFSAKFAPAISPEQFDTLKARIATSRPAERKLARLLGLTYLNKRFADSQGNDKMQVELVAVLKDKVKVEVVGTGISAVMRIVDLAFDCHVKLDHENDVVVSYPDARPLIAVGEVFEVMLSSLSVYEDVLTLTRVA